MYVTHSELRPLVDHMIRIAGAVGALAGEPSVSQECRQLVMRFLSGKESIEEIQQDLERMLVTATASLRSSEETSTGQAAEVASADPSPSSEKPSPLP